LQAGRKLSLQLSQRIGQHYIKGWPENTVAAPDGLDILVNNAGILRLAEVKDISLEDIYALLNVNVRDPIVASKAAIPHLGSEASLPTKFQGGAGLPVYALSKSALTAFSHGLARELGSRDITVNVVHAAGLYRHRHGPRPVQRDASVDHCTWSIRQG
jgi:3-oxoacyl-[acyl-carrier protein] reductase